MAGPLRRAGGDADGARRLPRGKSGALSRSAGRGAPGGLAVARRSREPGPPSVAGRAEQAAPEGCRCAGCCCAQTAVNKALA